MYRILSIDGGGIRGVIPALWLKQLEARLDKPLHECFQLIIGTSTGSILAAGIAAGIRVEHLIALYENEGSKIFPPRPSGREFALLERFMRPKYEEEPLEDVLRKNFANPGSDLIKLGELKTRCVIVAYDVFQRRPAIFRSWLPSHGALDLWSVVKGSCSAPTYFPAHILEIDGVQAALIDGGVVANNPASLGVAFAIEANRKQDLSAFEAANDLFVVSLGTGNLTKKISVEDARTSGTIQWAGRILDVVFDGTSAADDLVCEAILKPESYVRLQVELTLADDALDLATSKNINALKAQAMGYISEDDGRRHFERIIAELQS